MHTDRCATIAAVALAIAPLGPELLAAPQRTEQASDAKLERRTALIARARERGPSRVGDMLMHLPAEEGTSLRASRALRAWIESGGAPTATGIDRVVAAQKEAPAGATVEEALERFELALALASPSNLLEPRRTALLSLQTEDGAFPASRAVAKKERADDAALTARALFALLDARAGDLDASVRTRALEFLLRAQRADGGVGAIGAGSNGGATAASAALWLRCAAVEQSPELRERLTKALDRAERWLRENDRFDENPGARTDAFSWLKDHARAAKLLLVTWDPTKSTAHDRDAFLSECELPDWGWNRAAGLSDVHGATVQGVTDAPASLGVIVTVTFDFDDTASAVLALCDRTQPSEAETTFALRRRLATRASIPPAACWDALAESIRGARVAAVPILIESLEHEDLNVRRCADHLLRAITGEDFGFVPARRRDDARNAEALKAWRAWWSK